MAELLGLLGNFDFFILSLVYWAVASPTHAQQTTTFNSPAGISKEGLGSPYTWHVRIRANDSFLYNGTVYLVGDISRLAVDKPIENITVILHNKTEHSLTQVAVFLEGTAPKVNSTAINLHATFLNGSMVRTSIELRFLNDTRSLTPPYFSKPVYNVSTSVNTNASVPLITINASTKTRSPVAYHLRPGAIVTVGNDSGTLHLAQTPLQPGIYYTLLYVSFVNHPDIQNYTAVVIDVHQQDRPKNDPKGAINWTYSPSSHSEIYTTRAPTTDVIVSFPKHKMGCPAQKFSSKRWIPRKGTLLPMGLDVTIHNSNTMDTCAISDPDDLPDGKYCLYKENHFASCPPHFTQDALQVTNRRHFNITVEYCCGNFGFLNVPVKFPRDWRGPFYLFPFNKDCQMVSGFDVELDYMKWRVNYTATSELTRQETEMYKGSTVIKLFVCSYTFHDYWPTGDFGLLMPDEGCIDGLFMKNPLLNAEYQQYGTFQLMDGKHNIKDMTNSLYVCVRSHSDEQQAFPHGKYCVFGINDKCPVNMEKTAISIMVKKEKLFSLTYCCMESDRSTDIKLPTKRPFYLLQHDSDCQQVYGMHATRQDLEFKASSKTDYISMSPGNFVGVTIVNDDKVRFNICKYEVGYDGNNAGIVGGTTLTVLCLILAPVIYIRRRRCRRQRAQRLKKAEDQNLTSISDLKSTPREKAQLEIGSMLKMVLDAESQMTIYGFLIHPDKIETLDKVGKGAFGTVYRGLYRPDDNPLHAQDIAIKTLKENCVYPEISAFMEEAIVMADFQHANVLTMIGVCVHPTTHIPTLVLPFMEHGDLQKYLRKFRYEDGLKDKAPELHQLLSFCLHIARGMTYLSDMKFVHRDLAARNCMLDSNMVVKVADFGLTRDIYSNSYYRQDKNKLLPIKWMAIESLQDRVFSIYTDVWSYGVTVWEIFTLGKVPYPELENVQVLPELQRGQRLPKPDTCPDAVFELVFNCWLENSKERPGFVDIANAIEDALSEMSEYLDLDKTPARTVNISSGVICSPRELAGKETPSKTSYADYREASLRAKAQKEIHNL